MYLHFINNQIITEMVRVIEILPREKRTLSSCLVNTMAADDLANVKSQGISGHGIDRALLNPVLI